MFELLSELHTKTQTITSGDGKTITVHEPDFVKSNKESSTKGVKTIDVADKMIPEDKRAFELIQKNVEKYKQFLISRGKTAEANAIPDHILTPPKFVLGCYAYTFRKFPDNIEELTRTYGAMSAIKGRNPYYKMDQAHIDEFAKKSAERLADNIHELLAKEHRDIRKKLRTDKAMADLAVTSNFYWLNKFVKGSTRFPENTVLVPLGSSSGLVGNFTNNLSELTGAPIIHSAFIKSNNPKLSNYSWTEQGVELRMGTNFLSQVLKNEYGRGAVSKLIHEVKFFLTVYLGFDSSSLGTINTTKIGKAIDGLSPSQQSNIQVKYSRDPRFPEHTPKRYNTIQKQIRGFYNGMLKELRIALTTDFDEYTSLIDENLTKILELKQNPGTTDREKQESKQKIKTLQSQINNDLLPGLQSIPLPDLSTGGDLNKASYDKLKKALKEVHNFLEDIEIMADDYTDDEKLKEVIKAIQDSKTNKAGETLASLLQDLYLLTRGKVFKYSGAVASVGSDFNKGFSRFQLANLNVAKKLNGRHVVITDDNISSGGTVRDAVVSLYANGIVPLSIIVVAPHLLDNTAAKNETDLDDKTWKQLRDQAVNSVTAGDSEYRQNAITKIRNEVTLSNNNPKALELLADLAIRIINDDEPFKHIIQAQNILPQPFMYDNYIDTVVEMGKARDQYGEWYKNHKYDIGVVKQDAEQKINEFRPTKFGSYTEKQWKDELDKSKAEHELMYGKHAELKKAATAVRPVVTTKNRIDVLQNKLNQIRSDDPNDRNIPKFETTINFLKKQEMQEKGGYVGPDLDTIRKTIADLIQAEKYNSAGLQINIYSNMLHKRAKLNKQ